MSKELIKHNVSVLVDSISIVVCESVGNIDHNQNPFASISPDVAFQCNTLREASIHCKEYIAQHNLGGGNWTGGQVYHKNLGLIAEVSYNGRVWKVNTGKQYNEYTQEELDKNLSDFK